MTPKEKITLKLRSFHAENQGVALTPDQIAERTGIDWRVIHRIEQSAMQKIRAYLYAKCPEFRELNFSSCVPA